jgi:hypothetical protein
MSQPDSTNNDRDEKLRAELKKKGLVMIDQADIYANNNCFLLTLALCGASVYLGFKYTVMDANSFFWLAPLYALSAAFAIALSALVRRSFRKGLRSLVMVFIPVMMFTMFTGMFCGMRVVDALANEDCALSFADTQFAKLADANGVVHLADLLRVEDEQRRLTGEADALRRLAGNIADLRASSTAVKDKLSVDVVAASAAIEVQRMTPERQWEMNVVVQMASYVGTPETVDGKPSFAITRDQLVGSKAIISARYPHWAQLVELVKSAASHI